MSEYIFTLPDLGEGTVEAEVSEWHVKPGDLVQEDQALVDMLTDKAAVEVPAPVTGTVISLGGEPGDIIKVGAALAIFDTAQPAKAGGPGTASDSAASAAPPPSAPAAHDSAPKATESAGPAAADPAPPTQAPPITTAPAAARVEPVPTAPATPPVSRAAPPHTLHASRTTGTVLTSPAVRRLAREHQVDLSQISGSGPRGRIRRSDFDAFLDGARHLPKVLPPQRRTGTTEIKIIGMRRMIAQRMSASKTEIPHFSYVEEIDITDLEAFRQHLNTQYAAQGIRFSYLPLLLQAMTKALVNYPQCNARHDKERNVIVQHSPVHAGIATQTRDGLKVPVVHHAESMNLPTLAQEIVAAAQAARDGSASKSQLSGSTITITSLGKLGGIASTPVINQPEVAIIGVNRAVDRPMVVNGGIHIRRMMNLSASFDHRFVDGYDAAEFIQAVRELLENPEVTFAAG